MRNPGFETDSYRFINYAEMDEEDSKKIWELRNHPLVAKWMVNQDPIPYDSHVGFIDRLRTVTDKDYYIIKDKESNIIGSVNIDYTEIPYPERGLYINPDFFNRNHAYNTMKEFYRHAQTNWNVEGVMTRVKTDNAASNRLEQKLGAALGETRDGYNFYHLVF